MCLDFGLLRIMELSWSPHPWSGHVASVDEPAVELESNDLVDFGNQLLGRIYPSRSLEVAKSRNRSIFSEAKAGSVGIMKSAAARMMCVALCLMALIPPDQLIGQYTTASLSGTVVDSSGAAVPGAEVGVQNTETGFNQISVTDASGAYLFPRLPIGNYKLTAEKEGFAKYVQSGIQLAVSQAATQKVTLNVGPLAQQIAVSADASLVTTQSATISQVVSQRQIVDLPLDGRQVQQLVFLSAGVTDTTAHYCLLNCEGGVYPGEQYAKANGTSSGSINYQMDGVNYNDTEVNANLPFPNPDAIQEFSEQHSNMSAEYGNAVGGVVNVVTKSGTNQIHADLFEFVRNGDLNARNFFAPAQDTLKRNQFGGSVGGPIQKDHLFYFGTYQGTRIRSAPDGQISFVPTAAERTGDFSDLLPGTQLVSPITNAPYPGNKIPSSQISPAAAYFMNLIPLPNGPGGQITYLGPSQRQNDNQFMTKIDYVGGKHQLTGRYFFTKFNQPSSSADGNLLRVDPNGNEVRVQNISITDTYTVNPHLLLNSWFGWNQQNGSSKSGAPFCMPDAGVVVAATKPCELVVSVAGGFSIFTNHDGAFNRNSATYREDVTYIKSSHEFHFGAEAVHIGGPNIVPYQQNGQFYFNDNLSGNNLADFMLGQVSQFTQGGGHYSTFTAIKWSAFVQDNWRVTPRMTLNMGLRWDPYFPYQETEGRVGCFAPGRQSQRFPNAPVGLIFGGDNHDPGCPSGSTKTNAVNFAPRLGFAYRLTNDGKTAIRGGVGIYYGIPNTIAPINVAGIPPFSPFVSLTDVSFQNPYASAGVANPFPQNYGAIDKSPGADAQFPQGPVSLQIFSQDFRLPTILLWNLTLERQIATSWLVRAAYIGNRGSHLYGTGDQESGMLAANPAIYIPGHSTVANEQSRRIFPNYSNITIIDSSINSNYNSLQLTVEKRLTQGLSLLASYSHSKELNDFAPVGGSYAGYNSNPFNRHFDYGPSDDSLSHVFKFSGAYRFPRITANGLKDRLVNGWELSSIVTWQSGFPFTIFSGLDNSLSGNNDDRADFTGAKISQTRLASGRSHAEMIQEWFNTSLFVPNAIGTFGNTGKNILYGPRLFSTNMALIKDTRVSERVSVQFRAEAFNTINNVNFNLPDHTVTDTAFGQITSAQSPRILQFALKLRF